MTRRILGQLGMSMVESMVAMGLLGAAAVAAMNMDKLNFTQMGLAAGSSKSFDIIRHSHSTLQDFNACTSTLNNYVPGGGVTVPGIRDRSGNLFHEVGKIYDGLKVIDIKLDGPDLARQTYATTPGIGLVELRFVFQNTREKQPKDMIRRFKVWIRSNGAGEVIQCQTPLLLSTGLWQTSPTEPSDIYYGGGEVGVGVTDPNIELEINGQIRFATSDGAKAILGKGTLVNGIRFIEDRPLGVLLEDGTRANLLLNDLILGNVAQLKGYPSGTLACTAALEGAIRYNSTTGQFQFCGGDKWRSVVNVP